MSTSRLEEQPQREEATERLRQLASLPEWLRVLGDSAGIQEALILSVPELSRGDLRLTACKFKRAAMTGGSWTMTYRVKVEDPQRSTEREFDLCGRLLLHKEDNTGVTIVAGDFGSDQWRCYIPQLDTEFALEPPDVALPALPLLTDPDRARSLLEDAIKRHSPAYTDLELISCSPEVVHYKPGRRCSVKYDLELSPEQQHRGWPTQVIAKTYESNEGRNAYVAMRALWSSKLRTSREVTIAEPLALVQDPNMLVQASVPGEYSFKNVIRSSLASGEEASIDSLRDTVHKIGRGLGELHSCGVDRGDVVTLRSELDALEDLIDKLSSVTPEPARVAGPILAQLRSVDSNLTSDRPVPTHRSFRPAQVLVDGSAIAFIDFDGFCQAEPGLDLALFRLTVRDLALRALEKGNKSPAPKELDGYNSRLDSLCALFLEGYEEIYSVSRDRLALWEVYISLKEILDCWKKIKSEHLERRLRMLNEHLATGVARDLWGWM